MTLVIIPSLDFYGWFAIWDLAGLFAEALEAAAEDGGR